MASEFLQKVQNYFTTEFKQQIGLSLDEESNSIEKALTAIIPLGMSAAIQKVEKDNGKMSSVYSMSKSAATYFPSSPDLAKLHNEEAGNRIASDLFGSHERAVQLAVAKYAGIKDESAGALLMLTTPVLMGSLGILATEQNMSPDQLDEFVKNQRDDVNEYMPSGIADVAAIFGKSNTSIDEKHIKDVVKTESVQPKNKGWILPIILAILAVLLLIYFSRGCNKPPKDMENPSTDTIIGNGMILTPVIFIH